MAGLGILDALLASAQMIPEAYRAGMVGEGPMANPSPPLNPIEQEMMRRARQNAGGGAPMLSVDNTAAPPVAQPSVTDVPLTGTERQMMGMPPDAIPLPRPRPAEAPGGTLANAGDDDAAIPAAAQPTAGPVAAPAQTPSVWSRISDSLDQNSPMLLALGAGFAGAPSFGAGMSRAFGNAAPFAQKNVEYRRTQGGITATVAALRAKGVPEADIQAAMTNPELMKALITQNYGKDKLSMGIVGRDRNGQPIYGSFNSTTGEASPFGGQTENRQETAVSNGTTGDEFLATLDQPTAARVKAIAEGRQPYPATSRAVDAARIREAVMQYDPTFNSADYNSRLKTRQDFTSGKSAQNLSAFNTAIGHLETLYNSIDGLNNSGWKVYNKIANPIAENTDPKFAANLQKFQTARTAVADELTRAFRGSGGNVHDIKQWEEAINSASSPEALRAAVRQAAELLNSRIQAVGDQYNRGMNLTKDPLELLSPKNAKAFKHMLESGEPEAATPAAKAPANQSSALAAGKTRSGLSWKVVP